LKLHRGYVIFNPPCTADDKPLHVVIGVGGGNAWLITAYYPDTEKWENNYKTRKAGL